VDGIPLEKAMRFKESLLTAWPIRLLGDFIENSPLGVVLPPDGMLRLKPGQVRVPDINFISCSPLELTRTLRASIPFN
jgi:hypothetical protein